MRRLITGFVSDEHGVWVALLDCGHRQHVRHKPPLWPNPWVRDPAQRARRVGTPLDCPLCARGEPSGGSGVRVAGVSDYRLLDVGPAVYEYILANSTPVDPIYAAIRDDTRSATGDAAGMQIGPDQFTLMRILTQLVGARLAVEVGTFTGTSAAAIAGGLLPGGRIVCCDVSEDWTAIARRHWEAAGLADRIDLRIGPALDTIAGLPDEPIDLAFVDADKPAYPTYYDALVPRLRPGGLLLADNTLWSGHVADAEDRSTNTEAIRAYNARAAADERVDTVILPVGDGITLSRKR